MAGYLCLVEQTASLCLRVINGSSKLGMGAHAGVAGVGGGHPLERG